MKLKDLTQEEIKLIERHRAERIIIQEIIEKKKNCKHKYQYQGSYHNDDVSKCYLCGDIKFE